MIITAVLQSKHFYLMYLFYKTDMEKTHETDSEDH